MDSHGAFSGMTRVKAASAVLFLLMAAGALTHVFGTPAGFNFQGRLTDSNGVNRDGSFSIKFTIFDASTGGSALWSKTFPSLTVRNGNFQVILGDPSDNPSQTLAAAFASDPRFLEIQVLSGPPGTLTPEPPLVPRQQLVSVPYAIKSSVADSATSAANLASNSPITATVAGTRMATLDTQKLIVAGAIESTSNGFVFPDGTTQATASIFFAQQRVTYSSTGCGSITVPFTIARTAFMPNLPSNIMKLRYLLVKPTAVGFGTCGVSPHHGWGSVPGSPFHGTSLPLFSLVDGEVGALSSGVYMDAQVGDIINFTAGGCMNSCNVNTDVVFLITAIP